MAIELGLRALLLSQTSITSLAPGQRIGAVYLPGVFNEHAAQGFAPPYVIVHQISHDPMKTMDGTTGLAQTEFDVDCWALDYPKAVRLAEAVETYLKDYSGNAGPNDTIKCVLFDNKSHSKIPLKEGSDQWLHDVSLTFTIFHLPS